MHNATFAFKRAHLKGVAFGMSITKEKVPEMTPARFDLLYLIRRSQTPITPVKPGRKNRRGCRSGRFMTMREIIKRLDLHPSTVSKMVERLVRLGWVEKQPESDGRRKVVVMTDLGISRFERALRLVFKVRSHLEKFEDYFKQTFCLRGYAVLNGIKRLVDDVAHVAEYLGDRARLRYWYGYPGTCP